MAYTVLTRSLKKGTLFLYVMISVIMLPDLCSAQGKSRQKESKKESFFTIQGGLYHEWGMVQSAERLINVNHLNALKFGVGRMHWKKNKISQFNFEGSFFKEDFGIIFFNDVIVRGFEFNKLLIEAEYFKSVLSRDKIQNNFHFGYLLNLNFSREDATPFATNAFQRVQSCLCMGVGVKALFVVPLSKKVMLTIGSDINILDSGLLYDFNANPNIFINEQTSYGFNFDLWRPRLGIDVGIAF